MITDKDIGKIFKNHWGERIKIVYIEKDVELTHPVIGIYLDEKYLGEPDGYRLDGGYLKSASCKDDLIIDQQNGGVCPL